MQFKIPACNYNKVKELLESKINKRASKLGLPHVEINKVREESFYEKVGRFEIKRDFFILEVNGETPKINGWEFIAKITLNEGAEGIVKEAPGKVCPPKFFNKENYCDHCKQYRNRKDTFILHKDGVYQRIGRNCLADFLGGLSPEALLNYASFIGAFDAVINKCTSSEKVEYYYSVEEVLKYAACMVRNYGYEKVGSSRATAFLVSDIYHNKRYNPLHDDIIIDWEKDEQTALNVIKAVQENTMESSYFHNLKSLTGTPYITYRGFNLLVSAVGWFMKKKLSAPTTPKISDYQGIVGEKIIAKLTPLSFSEYENNYGGGTRVRFKDENNNIFIWWATSAKVIKELEVNEWYEIQATVKDHNEFQRIKQTVITRAKVLSHVKTGETT